MTADGPGDSGGLGHLGHLGHLGDLDDGHLPVPGTTERFLAAMSTLAATVTVIAAASPRFGRVGITATAVCSLSAEPPMLLACVNRSSSLARALGTTGWFSVNILSADQEAVAVDFSGRTRLTGEERFADPAWGVHPTGAPVLAGAVAVCVCHAANEMNASTHLVVIGTVHDVLLPDRLLPDRLLPDGDAPAPLMYHQRRFVRPGTPVPPPTPAENS